MPRPSLAQREGEHLDIRKFVAPRLLPVRGAARSSRTRRYLLASVDGVGVILLTWQLDALASMKRTSSGVKLLKVAHEEIRLGPATRRMEPKAAVGSDEEVAGLDRGMETGVSLLRS